METQTNVEHAIRDFKQGLGRFTEKLPDVGNKYMEFTAACFREGAVSSKNKHLTALGIAITTQDEYCILYHAKGALDNGASEAEILETVGVCAAFGGGAALAQGVTLVQQAIEQLSPHSH
ncbi:carboxymuconolactone decarboxylase family protein [Tumebacillus permanentifrigoris]|uniref:AhpD family alkylhydroperoxidase n=1 Tax=Tumebacillus permanentifrigoris TaxID=378543 RepID=A0A316DCB9_9BACL|nr:carboxymuconolactone decarboxylase family protein [Tumebacillus permanentifrigoris]PWK15851.1 AhpD family alkylhydroperoxidase [Tumebacillus permanentifrigoris]